MLISDYYKFLFMCMIYSNLNEDELSNIVPIEYGSYIPFYKRQTTILQKETVHYIPYKWLIVMISVITPDYQGKSDGDDICPICFCIAT
ncbi:hypothetical protein KSF78_0007729 [Schistosoma japonicum]|nr:hypothetical protein KSF78_0007729 [Schistosoma japonicum]